MRDLFIELLQVSLGTRDMLSRVPSAVEWGDLLWEANRQCVVGVFVNGIELLPKEQKPPQKTLLQWIGLAQIIEETCTLQCVRAKELTRLFRQVGHKTCVLKGIGIAQLYPVPSRRQGSDIDLWVGGPRKGMMRWLRTQCKVDHVLWHHVDAKFFAEVETEIHFHPCWLYNPFCNKRLQSWFEQQRLEQMDVDSDLGFAYPSVQFNVVYSLAHFYHHLIEEGVGLRHVVDYFYICKLYGLKVNDYREETLSVIKRLGLYKLLNAMMWVLQSVCGLPSEYLLCEPNEKEGRFLLDEIKRGGNFGHYRKDNRQRNSAARMFVLLPHYPREVLWVVPWKMWHMCWRWLNK